MRFGLAVVSAMVIASCCAPSLAGAELPRSGTITEDTTAVGPHGHAALISAARSLSVRPD